MRLSYKLRGKTVQQSLADPAERRKADREIAEFRRFQQLSADLVAVNERICRLRPVETEPASGAVEKKPCARSNTKSVPKLDACCG